MAAVFDPATTRSRFHIGQLVVHQRFDYRGVVYDVDPVFMLSDEWYDEVAETRPPKDEPWYHVLVDGGDVETYVAERNLLALNDDEPISHPEIETHFRQFDHGRYWPRAAAN